MSKICKLGLGIIAFEGLEHIKNIAYELKDQCDVIVICLQDKSYHGKDISEDDVNEANNLKELGYVDEIIWFQPNNEYDEALPDIARYIETDKRNYILDYLEKDCGCSHSIVIDSDEFYDHDDFVNAKSVIDNSEEVHVTYCQYVNYYRDYQHIMVWPYYAYVPFISESSYRFSFKEGSFGKPSDPTRRYLLNGDMTTYHILPYSLVKMHHFSWIRLDINKKLENWSAKKLFNCEGLDEQIVSTYTNYKDGENAVIPFKTPFYRVCVTKLPKKYIHPKYNLYQKPKKYEGYEGLRSNNVN